MGRVSALRRIACCSALLLMLAVADAAAELRAFQSPSKNIGCVAFKLDRSSAPSVRCDIAEQSNPVKPQPKSCNLDYGTAYEVGRRGKASRICHGDTTLNRKARVLAYGDRIRFHGIVCRSRQSGMRCVNRADHGFKLSRSGQRIF